MAWGIRMVPTGDGPTWMFSAEAWFEATNEVRLVLPEPGEYELWFQLRDEETWSSHEIGPDGPLDALLVEVLDGTAVQRIRVGLSAQTLDQALAELARMAVEEVGLPMPVPYDD